MVNIEFTDGKVLGSDEVIKLGSTDSEVLGTILGNTTSIFQALGIIALSFIGIYW